MTDRPSIARSLNELAAGVFGVLLLVTIIAGTCGLGVRAFTWAAGW